MPIARNSREFLAGRDEELKFEHRTVEEIAALALARWVVPRSRRRPDYRQFCREAVLDRLMGTEPIGSSSMPALP